MNLLELDGTEIEQVLRELDNSREMLGKLARKQAAELFLASRQACINEVGERTARCFCWWEECMDSWEDKPDIEKPLWIRLSDRAVLYDGLSCTLGTGNIPSDDFLCNGEDCDCPYYDEQGDPRPDDEVERRLAGTVKPVDT